MLVNAEIRWSSPEVERFSFGVRRLVAAFFKANRPANTGKSGDKSPHSK